MNIAEKIAVDIGKGIAWPFKHAEQVIEVVDTGLKDTPAVRAAIVGLIKQIGVVTSDAALAVAADGTNLPEDVTAAKAAESLFVYVKNAFLPAVETAFKDLAADIEPVSTEPTLAVAVVSVDADPVIDESKIVKPGPGLHTVTPA
jgi:hypothetical protein